jgi:hypothetical protein
MISQYLHVLYAIHTKLKLELHYDDLLLLIQHNCFIPKFLVQNLYHIAIEIYAYFSLGFRETIRTNWDVKIVERHPDDKAFNLIKLKFDHYQIDYTSLTTGIHMLGRNELAKKFAMLSSCIHDLSEIVEYSKSKRRIFDSFRYFICARKIFEE